MNEKHFPLKASTVSKSADTKSTADHPTCTLVSIHYGIAGAKRKRQKSIKGIQIAHTSRRHHIVI